MTDPPTTAAPDDTLARTIALVAELDELTAEWARRTVFALRYTTVRAIAEGKPVPTFACPACFATTQSQTDAANRWCQACRDTTGDPHHMAQLVIACTGRPGCPLHSPRIAGVHDFLGRISWTG